MNAAPRPCILCGAPRAPHAYKYCEACRLIAKQEWQRQANLRASRKRKQAAGSPAAEPGPDAGGYKAEVYCEGCRYWRTLNHTLKWTACHYAIDTPHVRGMPPQDCYKHLGTPYRPKGG